MQMKLDFRGCYRANNDHWTDFYSDEANPEQKILAILQDKYPKYFTQNKPNYLKIAKEIANKNARELFKGLFKLPYKLNVNITTNNSSDLFQIVSKYGSSIIAHGVEEAKGGMYNLLLMCVSNKVFADSSQWGDFVNGLPNISPLSHGPYYIIYSTPMNSGKRYPNYPSIKDIGFILVPFDENIAVLKNKLEEMLLHELISPESKATFEEKLITYAQLLAKLENCCSENYTEGTEVIPHPFSEDASEKKETVATLQTPKSDFLTKKRWFFEDVSGRRKMIRQDSIDDDASDSETDTDNFVPKKLF